MEMLLNLFEFVCNMSDATAGTPDGGIWYVLATIMEWLFS